MTVYTYSQARQNFASVLDKARAEGEVIIKRKDGTSFVIRPVKSRKSPLGVDGIHISLSASEIVDFVRESRSR